VGTQFPVKALMWRAAIATSCAHKIWHFLKSSTLSKRSRAISTSSTWHSGLQYLHQVNHSELVQGGSEGQAIELAPAEEKEPQMSSVSNGNSLVSHAPGGQYAKR
jgi:hypothetical protein